MPMLNKVSAVFLCTSPQGLTIVHYSAQFEPFLSRKHNLHTPTIIYDPLNNPETTLKQPLTAPPVTQQKALKLS
jgi:hypothetical protein